MRGATYRIGVGVASTTWLYSTVGIQTSPAITYLYGAWSDGQNVFTNKVNSDGFVKYISANFLAAPVPEPESYAMLLAGLGLLGVITRRRWQQ